MSHFRLGEWKIDVRKPVAKNKLFLSYRECAGVIRHIFNSRLHFGPAADDYSPDQRTFGVLQDTLRSNPDEKFPRTMEDGPDACLAVARQRRLIAYFCR